MKIAVTSQNFRTVTNHAGKARRFLVYEVAEGEAPVEVGRFDLPMEQALSGIEPGAAHPIDGVDVLLSASFGPGFVRRLAQRGITVSLAASADIGESIRAYLASGPVLPDMAAYGHGHGHEHGGCGCQCGGH